MAYLDQFPVVTDKNFSAEITAGGNLFKSDGTYTVVVQYGGPSISAETTFTFTIPIRKRDKKINDKLKSFLKSIGYEPAHIKIVEENIVTK